MERYGLIFMESKVLGVDGLVEPGLKMGEGSREPGLLEGSRASENTEDKRQ
jgi:hypothetical protein